MPEILSVREHPEWAARAIGFFQKHWGTEENRVMYDDCITHALTASGVLPQWYVLSKGEAILAGAALLPNDLISRMDLYPWLAALVVEPEARGHGYSRMLVEHIRREAGCMGYPRLYLSTNHVGFYEKIGFSYLGEGYHPWGEHSRIYGIDTGVESCEE